MKKRAFMKDTVLLGTLGALFASIVIVDALSISLILAKVLTSLWLIGGLLLVVSFNTNRR